jgi:peptidyl-prolyl cis-trans isomerase A (cyclophilin A)
MFINLVDNKNLDGMGFSPFAQVTRGMDVVDQIYDGYGEGGSGDGSDGQGPSQGRLQEEGNRYLKKVFPRLSYIVSTRILPVTGVTEEL